MNLVLFALGHTTIPIHDDSNLVVAHDDVRVPFQDRGSAQCRRLGVSIDIEGAC